MRSDHEKGGLQIVKVSKWRWSQPAYEQGEDDWPSQNDLTRYPVRRSLILALRNPSSFGDSRLVNQSIHDLPVAVDPAIAKEGPVAPDAFQVGQIALYDEELFFEV